MPNTSETETQNPLTANQYERIYQVIHALLEGSMDTSRACRFFAIAGSYILNKYHKIEALPVAGVFILGVDQGLNSIFFGNINDNPYSSNKDCFHMWVQTQNHVIDFMAPLFREASPGFDIPRRMFQRRKDSESQLHDPPATGNFYIIPNPDLSKYFVDTFFESPKNVSLLSAIDACYQPYPAPLIKIDLLDILGNPEPMKICAPPIDGMW